ncbi:MAG: hypothetical protein MUO19_07540 [Dehalococcoidales bacterium]|nr:hypothetical protein [Dehalococcoidales bacterium]
MLNNTSAILVIAGIILLFAINFTVQTVRTRKSPLGKIINLYREVKYNEKLVERFGYRGSKHRFRTNVWLNHKHEIEFLSADLLGLLAQTFEDIVRINETIDASVGGMQESYLTTVNVDPLKAPLQQAREQLDMWIKKNIHNPEFAPKRPRFFGR